MKQTLVSTVIDSQFPSFYAEDGSELMLLMKKYYEWMEDSGGVLNSSNVLTENFYMDTANVEFIRFFTDRIIPNIPRNTQVDKKLILKHAKNFYQSKGTEASFKFLFKAIFDKSVDIYYPKVDLMRTSSANWVTQSVMKFVSASPFISEIVGRKIYGVSTGATAIVDSCVVGQYGTQKYYTAIISSVFGVFDIDEFISTELNSSLDRITGRTVGIVSSYRITNGGSSYEVGDAITSTGGDGVELAMYVSEVTNTGSIVKLAFVNNGVGYNTTPSPVITSNNGAGAVISLYIGAVANNTRFIDDTDFLSASKKLQDSGYYQEFSYVVTSAIPESSYGKILDSLVHPAGMVRYTLVDSSATRLYPAYGGVRTTYTVIVQDDYAQPTYSINTNGQASYATPANNIEPFVNDLISWYLSTRIIDMKKGRVAISIINQV